MRITTTYTERGIVARRYAGRETPARTSRTRQYDHAMGIEENHAAALMLLVRCLRKRGHSVNGRWNVTQIRNGERVWNLQEEGN